MEGDFANHGISSEVVGLLILNELKCFRKELTNEVKNLARKLDRITATGDNCQNQPLKTAGTRKIIPSKLGWQNKSSFQASTQLNTSSFKEISPDSDNKILHNHIAFRMSNAYPTIDPSNQTIESANVYPDLCSSKNTERLEEQEMISSNANEDLAITSAYHEPLNEVTRVMDIYQEPITIEDDDNPVSTDFDKTQKWPPASKNDSINLQMTAFKIQTPKKKPMEKQELLSKCAILYKCTICDEQFEMESQYKLHYSEVHESNVTSQDLVSSSFWKDQSIKNVFDQPQPRVIYLCKVCSRDFSSRGSLLRHSMFHSGVKKFVCKICGKRFFRSDHLKSHLPTHSRQKQFQCNLCHKYFSRASIFEQHMEMHKVMQLTQNESNLNSGRFDGSAEETSSLPKINEESYVMKIEQPENIQ